MHDEITLGMIGDDENVYPIVAREFHQIPKWLAFRPISEVKASEKTLYAAVLSFQHINGKYSLASTELLAESIGMSKSNCERP